MARPIYHVLSRGEKLGAVVYPKNAFKLKALFAHLFTNRTTTVDGTRYLVNQGTDGVDAVMHTGQGVYSNGIDDELLVSGYIAQYIHWKDGVFTVTEINNTVTDYNLISAAGIYQWALLTNTTLTTTELSNIEQNPELALYWDNDVLTSDYFDTTKVFEWYPFTENVSAGGYYRNHALPIPSNLFDGFTTVQASWTDNLDGSYTGLNVSDFGLRDLRVDFGFALINYVLDFKVKNYSRGNIGNFGNALAIPISITEDGQYRAVLKGNTTVLTLFGFDNFTGILYDIKVYPLASSGLTPLANWTPTTSTNAQQLTTGYQCALQELGSFGLPINPVTIDVKADSLADAQAQFTSENGLTLTDNAGTLELYK